jgi:hypothetical protein
VHRVVATSRFHSRTRKKKVPKSSEILGRVHGNGAHLMTTKV